MLLLIKRPCIKKLSNYISVTSFVKVSLCQFNSVVSCLKIGISLLDLSYGGVWGGVGVEHILDLMLCAKT